MADGSEESVPLLSVHLASLTSVCNADQVGICDFFKKLLEQGMFEVTRFLVSCKMLLYSDVMDRMPFQMVLLLPCSSSNSCKMKF